MKAQVNEISIKYQGNFKISQAPKITSSVSAAELLFDTWNKDQIGLQECFKVMLLNNANRVKGIFEVSTGGITGTLVDLRILFAVVLKSLSCSVILLLREKIELQKFLKFVIEKLSFDNLPYVSVKDYKESIKEVKDEDLEINNEKINKFFRNSIVTNESLDAEIIESNFENLNINEQATAYKKLFETASKLLKLNFLSRPSYFNSSKFFRLYNPDFSNPILKNLPSDYFSKYIFEDPKIYLNRFIETYLDQFDNINSEAKKVFFDGIGSLLRSVDFEEENNITMIIEEYEQQFPLAIKKEIHKIYIDFYYSSVRNEGFAQKHYSKELFARKKIKRETITEWITKKIKNDLDLYKTKEDFNYKYFAYTYEDLGKVLDKSLDEWTEMVRSILYSLDKN
ncbi:JAB domain-containing protein [Christiangramia flava]|uniref:DNA repair protein RadC n=1 Tax=Christiangramia flava JLT2011 TaxID=1229726 RepID=A0A1L7I948_9FLAO|nr:JAB domain-containing protein [Christiangramia flava]APU70128.1 DNA repair protein RadC [Christiangramia flava JLT2011]OSS39616.1 DNA repair protein RadC [Christiangramia flava JLT2011]